MLAALGMFVFDITTAAHDQLTRNRDWRHVRTERFGARAASQFLGPGEDKITLAGTLVPEITGSYAAIDTLAAMADQGEAYPLMDGTGLVFGQYTIDRIEERHGSLIDNGKARVIGFSIELTRVV